MIIDHIGLAISGYEARRDFFRRALEAGGTDGPIRRIGLSPAFRPADGLRAGRDLAGASSIWPPCRAPVAQLDRVLPSEGRGRAFESRRAHQFNKIR